MWCSLRSNRSKSLDMTWVGRGQWEPQHPFSACATELTQMHYEAVAVAAGTVVLAPGLNGVMCSDTAWRWGELQELHGHLLSVLALLCVHPCLIMHLVPEHKHLLFLRAIPSAYLCTETPTYLVMQVTKWDWLLGHSDSGGLSWVYEATSVVECCGGDENVQGVLVPYGNMNLDYGSLFRMALSCSSVWSWDCQMMSEIPF